MADAANEGAFVEATILAPNGSVQVYNPLVITAGTTPAAAPTAPTIARGSAVIIDVGSNGNNLVLEGRGARQGNCVDALGQSVIGQVSACNAVSFYRVANAEIANGTLKVPAIGTSEDGQPCETVRNFALIDQDQSDNVITTYLINANGQTAQDTAANANAAGRRHAHRERQRRPAAGQLRRPGQRVHRVQRARHHRRGRHLRLAGAQRAERAGQPDRDHRGRPGERRDDAGQQRLQHRQDQRLPVAGRPAAAGRQHGRHHGGRGLLPEHGQHRPGAQPAGHGQGSWTSPPRSRPRAPTWRRSWGPGWPRRSGSWAAPSSA